MRWLFQCCITLWIALSVAAAAETVVSPADARQAAAVFLTQGHPQAALDVTTVLLTRDPHDVEALILQAHAQRTLKDFPSAQASAREAWRHSTTDEQKFASARTMAQALSSGNKKSRAMLWLRRAAHVAPTEQMRASIARDYRFVRMTNPVSLRFRFGISPSDNVNNAPRSNRIILGGLLFEDETAIPLSGIEARVGIDLRYNFNVSQTRRDFARASWDQIRVFITDDNKPASVKDSDFRYTRLETAIGRDFKTSAKAPNRSVSLSLGRIWSGKSHLSDEIRGRYRETHTLHDGGSFTWHTSIGYADRQDNALRSGTTTRIGIIWSKYTMGGSRLSLIGGLSRTNTDSAVVTHDGWTVGATYSLGRPIMGALATFSAYGNFRRYDEAVYGPDPRRDDSVVLSTSLFFKDFDTYGFAPKVTFTARRTDSNITRFDTRQIGLSIGFESVF